MDNMDNIKEKTKKTIEKPMSNFDIKKYLPDVNIITNVDLLKIKNIDQLFKGKLDSVVILFVDTVNLDNGHWVALSRYLDGKGGGIIEFFDSYGNTPDNVYNFCSPAVRKQLGLENNYLDELINKSKYYFICNTFKYQQNHKQNLDINTCGRHVTYRIIQLLYNKKVLPEYNDFMKYAKRYFKGKSYDEIVSILIDA